MKIRGGDSGENWNGGSSESGKEEEVVAEGKEERALKTHVHVSRSPI